MTPDKPELHINTRGSDVPLDERAAESICEAATAVHDHFAEKRRRDEEDARLQDLALGRRRDCPAERLERLAREEEDAMNELNGQHMTETDR